MVISQSFSGMLELFQLVQFSLHTNVVKKGTITKWVVPKKTIMSKINGIISYLLIFFVYFCSQGHSYSHQTFFNRPNYKGGFYKLCRGDF